MKASVFKEFGPPEVQRLETVADPIAGPGEVVVRVAACGINRYDLYLRQGAVFRDVTFPHVLGADVAGTVAWVGPEAGPWREGDPVIVAPGFPVDPVDWGVVPENRASSFEVTGTHSWGGNAEYVRVPGRFLFRDETGLPSDQVAAMPLVLMTAVHAVLKLGEVKPDHRVLVQAGASGSGHVCIQVAVAAGARVATTVGSEAKVEIARTAGAELVIPYRDRDFANDVLDWTDGAGVDVVVDNVGASVFSGNLRALKVGGVFVNFGLVGGIEAPLNFRELFFRQLQLRGSFMGGFDDLRRGLELLKQGKVRAFIDRRFPLGEACEAHRFIESRAVRGKVVLVP